MFPGVKFEILRWCKISVGWLEILKFNIKKWKNLKFSEFFEEKHFRVKLETNMRILYPQLS